MFYDESSSSEDDEYRRHDGGNQDLYRDWLDNGENHRVTEPNKQPFAFPGNVAYQCDGHKLLADALGLITPRLDQFCAEGNETARVRVDGLTADVVFDLAEVQKHTVPSEQIWHGARQACVALGVAPLVWRWGDDGYAHVNYTSLQTPIDLETLAVLQQSFIVRSMQRLGALADSLRHKINAWGFEHTKESGGWWRLRLLPQYEGKFTQHTHPNWYPTARTPVGKRASKRKRGDDHVHECRRLGGGGVPRLTSTSTAETSSSSSEPESVAGNAQSGVAPLAGSRRMM